MQTVRQGSAEDHVYPLDSLLAHCPTGVHLQASDECESRVQFELEEPEHFGELFESKDVALSFMEVLREERRCLDRLRSQRLEEGRGSSSFSVTFSGGGVRAAAFQAGVLWRLAREDLLKDVEYWSAVSGGGYVTAAFASHCYAADRPLEGQVRAWYLHRVAETLCRMQANAGNFVRDCLEQPGKSSDGAGRFPRIFDLPILVLTTVVTLCINPFKIITFFLVPLAVYVELYYGAGLRAAFCAPRFQEVYFFMQYSSIQTDARMLGVLGVVCFVVYILRPILGLQAISVDGKSLRRRTPRGYLVGHAFSACLTRLTLIKLVFTVSLFLMLYSQIAFYKATSIGYIERTNFCRDFIQDRIERETGRDAADCVNIYDGKAWHRDASIREKYGLMPNSSDRSSASHSETVEVGDKKQSQLSARYYRYEVIIFDLMGRVLLFSIATLGCSIFVIPLLGASVFKFIIRFVGPVLLAALAMWIARFAVFGPISLEVATKCRLSQDRWEIVVTLCFGALLFAPLYEEIRNLMHVYYKRTLRQNYFSGGKDINIVDLVRSPYCPFIILSAISSDYQPSGHNGTICEISFSMLHCGGCETGYIRQEKFLSLAKCMALSGAGLSDAISLSMKDTLTFRFWLEMLNLTWGDYLLFKSRRYWFIEKIARMSHCQDFTNLFLQRLPGELLNVLVAILLNVGWGIMRSGREESCATAKYMFNSALILFLMVYASSFFSFVPVVEQLALSPFLRTIHQATKYFFVGQRPPPMLYVTDGGVKDCTGLHQLLRRGCERILLVLAASDPDDDFGVLKAAFEEAVASRLCSFYDPQDPRNNLDMTLESFKHAKNATLLRIGIKYDPSAVPSCKSIGRLLIVKNRLPTSLRRQNVQLPLTREEILQDVDVEAPAHDWGDLTTDQLGSFGCCNCCHRAGFNCGPKFPHGSFAGYLCLTPIWFSSLARLGFTISKAAIDELSRGSLIEAWEAEIGKV